MWPVFTDPKTDIVFKRIFGTEPNKRLLIELLNALLDLEGEQRIADLTYLSPDQRVPVAELKLSIVDVKCRDHGGREYVVKVQTLTVEAFEKRVVQNVSKDYVPQLDDHSLDLSEVVGVTICDFEVWPAPPQPDSPPVPMLSRWRPQKQNDGALSQVQHVFLELPKYKKGAAAETTVERWAHFFRVATSLSVIPPELTEEPFRTALEQARTTGFTFAQWDAYDRAKVAEQDARGAISLAERQGFARGFARGLARSLANSFARDDERGIASALRRGIEEVCELLTIPLDASRRTELGAMTREQLEALLARLERERRWD